MKDPTRRTMTAARAAGAEFVAPAAYATDDLTKPQKALEGPEEAASAPGRNGARIVPGPDPYIRLAGIQ